MKLRENTNDWYLVYDDLHITDEILYISISFNQAQRMMSHLLNIKNENFFRMGNRFARGIEDVAA